MFFWYSTIIAKLARPVLPFFRTGIMHVEM